MEKIWKDVKDYEGLYRVSNSGEVERNGRILRPGLHSKRISICEFE